MLHSDVFAARIAASTQVTQTVFSPISNVQATQLERALHSDAGSLAQVAIASLFEGISGVALKRYSWAKVKFYYSAFYSIRAMLMTGGTSIFYVGRSPHSLNALPGQVTRKRSGNSHTAAFLVFREQFKNDIVLSQEIAGSNPLDWIEDMRNSITYRTAPFQDPLCPPEFSAISPNIRRGLQEYYSDTQLLYSFDKDHAMISYPILLLRRLSEYLRQIDNSLLVLIDKHYLDILNGVGCVVPEMKKALLVYDFS